MDLITTIWWAFGGALVAYLLNLQSNKNFTDALKNFSEHKNLLLFDFSYFLVMGVIVTVFFIKPESKEQAFLAGASWKVAASALLGMSVPAIEKVLPKGYKDQGELLSFYIKHLTNFIQLARKSAENTRFLQLESKIDHIDHMVIKLEKVVIETKKELKDEMILEKEKLKDNLSEIIVFQEKGNLTIGQKESQESYRILKIFENKLKDILNDSNFDSLETYKNKLQPIIDQIEYNLDQISEKVISIHDTVDLKESTANQKIPEKTSKYTALTPKQYDYKDMDFDTLEKIVAEFEKECGVIYSDGIRSLLNSVRSSRIDPHFSSYYVSLLLEFIEQCRKDCINLKKLEHEQKLKLKQMMDENKRQLERLRKGFL